ncbi:MULTISPECIES: HU family DNA-binding protein [Butyricimonas]|jgi:nucleoid DNA-binding protein|uniref:HU family DNA-binding protein n=1 Tax=Butyricimonas virosa TaxID=544645 RepID=A0ABX7H3S9_9BACT|nr:MULTISPECIES: HU family DNA-binding protein [Butyricimonas]MBO4960286.1 HU family DNA-binding protein [Butyricimonas sp.]MCI6413808.1 HU family DNA-binding protein [Butyricimonas virosa]MCI7292601.1 HU family DNA-binding protein [Butyricimonas virosa]MCI7390191.1 HU family DNA-binding protein [Butyricimonas virosa]MDY4904543.1 HU family DNA-binding protein [Butyricimonas virosa]
MDKRKIVKIVAQKNGMSQKDVTMVFDEIFSTMLEGLKEEGHVGLSGFGSFNVKKCAVRHRYVLSTQKVVLYPENKKVIFRVAKQFKFKADGVEEE